MMKLIMKFFVLILLILMLVSCRDETSSLLFKPQDTDGAQILVETHLRSKAQILPYSPLPHDDFLTEAGLQLPYPDHPLAKTWVKQLQFHQGASTHPMIMVPFSRPIDLQSILAVHQDHQTENDLIYLMDAQPDMSEDQAANLLIPLQFGFQVNAKPPFAPAIYPYFAEYALPLLRFVSGIAQVELSKELNKGFLQPIESTDNQEPFWLMFKPAIALKPNHPYVVVITGGIRDANGLYIASPRETHPISQREAILPLLDRFSKIGASSIAYAWIFHTEPEVNTWLKDWLLAVQNQGGFAEILQAFMPKINHYQPWKNNPCQEATSQTSTLACLNADYRLPKALVAKIANAWYQAEGFSERQAKDFEMLFDKNDGVFAGRFSGWRMNANLHQTLAQSRAKPELKITPSFPNDFEGNQWQYLCFLPKGGSSYDLQNQVYEQKKPFPVAIWAIDQDEHLWSLLRLAPHFNQIGYALCGIEGFLENDLKGRSTFDLVLSAQWANLLAQTADLSDYEIDLVHDSIDQYAQTQNQTADALKHWEKDLQFRSLNHAFAQLQFIEVLKQSPFGQELQLVQDFHFGGVGLGANVALITSALFGTASTLSTVDLSSAWADLAVSSSASEDQLLPLHQLSGSWLLLEQEESKNTYQLSMLVPEVTRQTREVQKLLIETGLSLSENTQINVIMQDEIRYVGAFEGKRVQLISFATQAGERFQVELTANGKKQTLKTFKQAFTLRGQTFAAGQGLKAFYDGAGGALGKRSLQEIFWLNHFRQQADHPNTYIVDLQQSQEGQKTVSQMHFHHLGNDQSTSPQSFEIWQALGLLDLPSSQIPFDLRPADFLLQSQALLQSQLAVKFNQQSLGMIDSIENATDPTVALLDMDLFELDLDDVDELQDDLPSLDRNFKLRLTLDRFDHQVALRFPYRPFQALSDQQGLRSADLGNRFDYDLYTIQSLTQFVLAKGNPALIDSAAKGCLFYPSTYVETCPFNQIVFK